MKCWDKKTPLERALLLILCISIPFLLGMIFAYIYFLVIDSKQSLDCGEFCDDSAILMGVQNLTHGKNKRVWGHIHKFRNRVDGSSKSQSIAKNQPSKMRYREFGQDEYGNALNSSESSFPFLASISQNYYRDDDMSKEYLCSGAILTLTYVLTAGTCVQLEGRDFYDVNDVFVRVGSDFWSKGGSVRNAKRIILSSDKKLAAILMEIPFPNDRSVRPLKLKRFSLNFHWNNVAMVGWKTSEDLPLRYRGKYMSPAKIGLVSCSDEVEADDNEICSEEKERAEICTNDTGSLLTDSEYLYGIQVDEVCFGEGRIRHMYESTERYLKWIKTFAIGVVVV